MVYYCFMRKKDALNRLAKHANEFRSLGAKALYVVGSTARDAASQRSDVDLLVDLKDRNSFSLFDLLELRYRAEAILGRRADVVTREGLHPAIRKTVLAEAVRVF